MKWCAWTAPSKTLSISTCTIPGAQTWHRLDEAYSRFSPDIVFYIEGADPYINDLGGGMGISKEGLLPRDQVVFESVMNRNLPLVIILEGGYGPEAWEIHYQFISEIMEEKNIS